MFKIPDKTKILHVDFGNYFNLTMNAFTQSKILFQSPKTTRYE